MLPCRLDGKVSGEYAVTSQGANIYGFDYRNPRNGKQLFLRAAPWMTPPASGNDEGQRPKGGMMVCVNRV